MLEEGGKAGLLALVRTELKQKEAIRLVEKAGAGVDTPPAASSSLFHVPTWPRRRGHTTRCEFLSLMYRHGRVSIYPIPDFFLEVEVKMPKLG